MKIYKVTAKFGNDTVKFDLPLGMPQETHKEALDSARIVGARAFGHEYKDMTYPETLRITIDEKYED